MLIGGATPQTEFCFSLLEDGEQNKTTKADVTRVVRNAIEGLRGRRYKQVTFAIVSSEEAKLKSGRSSRSKLFQKWRLFRQQVVTEILDLQTREEYWHLHFGVGVISLSSDRNGF